jgi:hypothetical protein
MLETRILPPPAPRTRTDGWSPERQRQFLEVLAETGVVRAACDAVGLSHRSAYNLRIRADGAAFRLGWDAAILIARARLADELLARAIEGQEEVINRDEYSGEIVRRRHDNRLAMSLLGRLDRMADAPPEGSDAALARVAAQDFAAYLDMICADPDSASPALSGEEEAEGESPAPAASPLSPGASAALFLAARMAPPPAANGSQPPAQEQCELHSRDAWQSPELKAFTARMRARDEAETPEELAATLRGVWWDDEEEEYRTDFPPPPGFMNEEEDEDYVIGDYERPLTPAEEAVQLARDDAERALHTAAAANARDAFFGIAQ